MSKKDTGIAFFFQDFALTLYLAEGIDSIPFITYILWKHQISNYQAWFQLTYLCPKHLDGAGIKPSTAASITSTSLGRPCIVKIWLSRWNGANGLVLAKEQEEQEAAAAALWKYPPPSYSNWILAPQSPETGAPLQLRNEDGAATSDLSRTFTRDTIFPNSFWNCLGRMVSSTNYNYSLVQSNWPKHDQPGHTTSDPSHAFTRDAIFSISFGTIPVLITSTCPTVIFYVFNLAQAWTARALQKDVKW